MKKQEPAAPTPFAKRREIWKAVDELVTSLEGFTPGERGVIINAASSIISITETQTEFFRKWEKTTNGTKT